MTGISKPRFPAFPDALNTVADAAERSLARLPSSPTHSTNTRSRSGHRQALMMTKIEQPERLHMHAMVTWKHFVDEARRTCRTNTVLTKLDEDTALT